MRHSNIYSKRYIYTPMSFFSILLRKSRQLKDSINPSEFLFKSHIQCNNTFHLHLNLLFNPPVQNGFWGYNGKTYTEILMINSIYFLPRFIYSYNYNFLFILVMENYVPQMHPKNPCQTNQ